SVIAYTPRPATAGRGRGPTRQRWEGEGRPVPSCGAARENGGSLSVRHCEERDNRDAPHPPIASQWAPPSPCFAGERCMGGAWPGYGGPKMCESDSGEGRDPWKILNRLPTTRCTAEWVPASAAIACTHLCWRV